MKKCFTLKLALIASILSMPVTYAGDKDNLPGAQEGRNENRRATVSVPPSDRSATVSVPPSAGAQQSRLTVTFSVPMNEQLIEPSLIRLAPGVEKILLGAVDTRIFAMAHNILRALLRHQVADPQPTSLPVTDGLQVTLDARGDYTATRQGVPCVMVQQNMYSSIIKIVASQFPQAIWTLKQSDLLERSLYLLGATEGAPVPYVTVTGIDPSTGRAASARVFVRVPMGGPAAAPAAPAGAPQAVVVVAPEANDDLPQAANTESNEVSDHASPVEVSEEVTLAAPQELIASASQTPVPFSVVPSSDQEGASMSLLSATQPTPASGLLMPQAIFPSIGVALIAFVIWFWSSMMGDSSHGS